MTVNATEELVQLSWKIVEAIKGKNADLLGAVLHEKFVQLSSDGQRQTKQEFVGAIEKATYTISEIELSSLCVECLGEVGVAVGIQRARGHLPDGQEFVSVGAFTDIFRRTDGGWRLWLAHTIELPWQER